MPSDKLLVTHMKHQLTFPLFFPFIFSEKKFSLVAKILRIGTTTEIMWKIVTPIIIVFRIIIIIIIKL